MSNSRPINVKFDTHQSSVHRGWLKYFVAAVGAGLGMAEAQEQAMLDYWWVMPREEEQSVPRVFRVIGEKGHAYEAVDYGSMKDDPAIRQAAILRQVALRQEAMKLAQELQKSGKAPLQAYEEAWTRVFDAQWLGSRLAGDGSVLEAMLIRLASEEKDYTLTPEEERWLIEALLEDDDRLENEQAQVLLRTIARHIRSMGQGRLKSLVSRQDELMQNFADALGQGQDSMTAYRSALFRANRDRIMHHQLRGYYAPWGMGLGGRSAYRQAAVKVTPTAGSANTQLPGAATVTPAETQPEVDFTAGMDKNAGKLDNFLATAPDEQPAETEDEEEKKKEKEVAAGNQQQEAPVVSSTGPMRSTFSLRAAGPASYAVEPVALTEADLKVNGGAALYFTNGGLKTTDKTKVKGSNTSSSTKRTYSVSTYGSYDGTINWRTTSSNSSSVSYWTGSGSVSTPGRNATTTDSSTNSVNKTLNIIQIGSNDKLYMGGTNYQGLIRVETGATNAYLGSYLMAGVVYDFGKLSGNGTLTLMSHGSSNQASIYSFADTSTVSEGWFNGTICLGASRGGIIELDLGDKGATTAWSDTLFEMTGVAATGHDGKTATAPSSVILNIRGDVAIAGLDGGSSKSTVTSESGDYFYDLTLGDEAGKDYVYSGTFNGKYYTSTTASTNNTTSALDLIKTGANQQTITVDVSNNSNRLHSVTVNGGTLRFDHENYNDATYSGSLETRFVTVTDGELLVNNLTVTGEQVGAAEFMVSGGRVVADGDIQVHYDMGVMGGASVSADNVSVGNTLGVSGEGSTLTVAQGLEALALRVELGGTLTTRDITVESNLEVGTADYYTEGAVRATLISTGDLVAGELRLRGDGKLVTGASSTTLNGAHMHGGAVWEMAGKQNTLTGLLRLEDVGGSYGQVSFKGNAVEGASTAVLTLPGMISLADANWNNGKNALFALDNVLLDFRLGVTLSNTGMDFKEGQTLILASTTNGGGYVNTTDWVRVESHDSLYHGVLGYDNSGNVIITIEHKLANPYVMASGDMLYIEMYQDAHTPALPYKAHTSYNTTSKTWSGNPQDTSLIKFSNLQISEGANLYLGEDLQKSADAVNPVDYRADRHFGGNIEVSITSTANDAVLLHGEIGTWGNWYLDGHLSGKGELKLVAHNTNNDSTMPANPASSSTSTSTSKSELSHTTTTHANASTFTFTNATNPEQWFTGKLTMANPHGGTVQLNIGNVNIADGGDTRWKNTVIDLTSSSLTDKATNQKGTAAGLVLGLMGDATVAGITGSTASSTIVSNVKTGSTKPSPVLTIGTNGTDYAFSGNIGAGRFYTGGQAYSVVSTLTTTTTTNNGSSTTTTVTTLENNFLTMEQGAISLTKVGDNTQTFSGKVYLDKVLVADGHLKLTGAETVIEGITVLDGAMVTTASGNVTLGSMSLYGGSTWYTLNSKPDSYDVTLNLLDVYGENGGTSSIHIGASNASSWVPSMYVNLANAGTWYEGAGAIFTLDTSTTLDLSALRVLTNLSGIDGGELIALYKVPNASAYKNFKDDVVMVEGADGYFYDADYILKGDTIYLQLEQDKRHYGIVINEQEYDAYKGFDGYIWSGENTGTTKADVHHINLTMGTVWRADGSAENTGWHEQRAVGSSNDDIGKYVDGNRVYFLDTDAHGNEETHRMVQIVGSVAPGEIIIRTGKNAGFIDPSNSSAEYHLEYAYAFVNPDGTGCITDYVDAEGNVIPTSITIQGVTNGKETSAGLVVINLTNTFSGGIDVQNGGLYLATVGAAGSGALTFHTDQEWSFDVQGQSVGVVDAAMNRVGAELMICYQHSDDAVSGFRGSTLRNDIILSSTKTTEDYDFAGNFKVSFAYAAFNESYEGDHNLSNIPRHWRNLTLSGALVGTGYYTGTGDNKTWVNTSKNDILELTGYCSTWANTRDQSYTTVLTLNEDTAGEDAYIRDAAGKVVNRFLGTVVMKNTINTSPLPSNELSKRTAGTVQLVLKGDKLADAHLDMTRESVYMGKIDASYEELAYRDKARQTYNNILVLNGDTRLNGLSAAFQGCGWDYPESNDTGNQDWFSKRQYEANLPQNDEVWHVRTLTNGLNTLSLGTYGDTSNTATYVYSGAMGFAQAYAGTSQAHIPWGDGFMEHTAAGWYFGDHSMAVESLSLTKASASTQYIHTAVLEDVSVYEGTLGFNSLELKGNLNLVGGSTMKLGVTNKTTSDVNWVEITSSSSSVMQAGYEKVVTSKDVTVNAGKTLTVFTPYTDDDVEPTSAVVDGNVIMGSGATLTFLPNGMVPDYTYDNGVHALLDVNGTLTFKDASVEKLTVNLTGVNFSQVAIAGNKYTYFYLAEADNIVVGTNGDSSAFKSRIMSLGYGYFGVLDTLDSSRRGNRDPEDDNLTSPDAKDYLVIRVYGDPRCTWSGKKEVTEYWDAPIYTDNVWTSGKGAFAYDYRWKENTYFEDGMTVLFGNLYEPVAWTPVSNLDSTQTPIVDLDARQPGNPSAFVTVDDHVITPQADKPQYTYEHVSISGRVAPLSVVINSDYFDTDGNRCTDFTNYIFTSSAESPGYIADATEDELKIWKDEYGVEDLSWKTNLTKLGSGTTIMPTDNRFTGGSQIIGGRIVMQHVNALGFVYNTGAYATPDDKSDDEYNLDDAAAYKDKTLTGLNCTITLMNGGELMGDFSDSDFPGNHQENITSSMGAAMETTTIRNKVVVNVYADPNTPNYNTLVDGRIFNNTEHKLVLSSLEGESDTVVEFAGVGYTEEQSMAKYGVDNMFRYGVFKVLDPSAFYGTVSLSGKYWNVDKQAGTATLANGGQVQLNLMSATKSGSKDWTNATVDLSIKDGTDRTVLGLDATGQATGNIGYECVYLNSIQGQVDSGSSSVLNMSVHNPLTLILTGTRNGEYEGVMGYGDFEVSVDYGGYAGKHGTTQHHYGAVGYGSLNLIKKGEGSIQTARRAWLNSLEVQGGTFLVDEALVAHDITTGGGKRVMVGEVDKSTLYALAVGAGGTLAMNTTFNVAGAKQDAWAGVSAGTTVGDSTTPAGWVLLEDGATLSAREDWYTRKKVDLAPGASVTINTHNFIIDPYLTEQFNAASRNDVFGKYDSSHIIQLLGEFSGRNVNLTINNQLTDAAKKDAYVDLSADSPYIGYVALNDLNDLTGSSTVHVDSMTVLQILNANGGVKADVDITVEGTNATLQILDRETKYSDANTVSTSDTMVQYIDSIVFGVNEETDPNEDPFTRENNGQLLLGGSEQTSLVKNNARLESPDMADMQVVISSRHNNTTLQGKVTNLNVDMRGAAVRIGGDAGTRTEMSNVHVDMARSDVSHTIYQTNLRNSMIHLMEDCSVNLADMVRIDKNSVVRGVNLSYSESEIGGVHPVIGTTVDPHQYNPNVAAGNNPTSKTKEVTTSVNTTVELTFADDYEVYTSANGTKTVVLQAEQFLAVDVTGTGLTIQLQEDMLRYGYTEGARFIGVMIGGDSGHFLYEADNTRFSTLLDSQFVLMDSKGQQLTGHWVTSTYVSDNVGMKVTPYMIYFETPEPTTTTLSLLALTALCARRRRR